MVSRVYLSPTKTNAIVWDLSIPLILSNSRIITASNTLSITRYDNGMPVVYRVGASDNPPNFTQLVRNIPYFIEVKTAYWLNNAIPSTAVVPQPLNANLTSISNLILTAFGLGFLSSEDAKACRDKIGVASAQELQLMFDNLSRLLSSQLDLKQPLSEELTLLSQLSSTDFGRQLLSSSDASAARIRLGAVHSDELANYAYLTPDGTIPTSLLANQGIVNVESVGSEEEMLGLTELQAGDTVIRRDLETNKVFVLLDLPATEIGNWERTGIGIQTLNGQTGPLINLGAGDIGADPAGSSERVAQSLVLHEVDLTNPHQVTVDQVGGQPRSPRLDAIAGADAGILKVKGDTVVQVASTPVGELILNTRTGTGQLLTPESIVFPSAAVVPIFLTANTTLTKTIATGVEGRSAIDGQPLTLINTSTFWLYLPALGGMRMIAPGSSLTFIYSAELDGWTAPATLKTLTCRVFNSGDQIILAGANLMTPLIFDSTRWDTSGGVMRDKVNNNRLIAPVSGHYTFNGHCQIGSPAVVGAFLRINGALVAGSYINGNPYLSFPGSYFMAAGAFADLALRVYSLTATATVARVAPLSPELEMRLYNLA